MPPVTPTRQPAPHGKLSSNSENPTTTEPREPPSLFLLPPEVRLTIYKALFVGTKGTCTLRRPQESRARKAHPITPFPSAILATSKAMHAEALPPFYASQTFHYTAERGGIIQPPTVLRAHLALVKHMSIEVSVTARSFDKLDNVVARHVETMTLHCARLSSFTLHVVPAAEWPDLFAENSALEIPETFTGGAAGAAIKRLRPRLMKLAVVGFGNWYDLQHLRDAIAPGDEWVDGGIRYDWPALRLTRAQEAPLSVRQRRYTVVGSEDIVHPHKQCIRVFTAYRPTVERKSRGKGR